MSRPPVDCHRDNQPAHRRCTRTRPGPPVSTTTKSDFYSYRYAPQQIQGGDHNPGGVIGQPRQARPSLALPVLPSLLVWYRGVPQPVPAEDIGLARGS